MPKEYKRELLTGSPLTKPTPRNSLTHLRIATAKSPLDTAPALPTSVENSYRKKCLELKKRIREIEESNDVLVLRIQRSRKGIQRARLERAFLLQQLEDRTEQRVDDSEGSPSPPPIVSAIIAVTEGGLRDGLGQGAGALVRSPVHIPWPLLGIMRKNWALHCAPFHDQCSAANSETHTGGIGDNI